MVKSLIGAFLVLRLETRQVPLDLSLIALTWLRRPAIEIVLPLVNREGQWLRQRLDAVYPF